MSPKGLGYSPCCWHCPDRTFWISNPRRAPERPITHSLSYVTPSSPHTGSRFGGQFSGRGSSSALRVRGFTRHTRFMSLRMPLQGSARRGGRGGGGGGQAHSNPAQGGASKKPPQPPSTPGCPPWGSGCSYPTNQEHPGCHQPRRASHSHPVALLGAEQLISALQPAQKHFHTFPRGQTGPGTFPGDLTAFLTSCF